MDSLVRNTTELDDDGTPPYHMSKAERLDKLVRQMRFPRSYTSNSPKEDLCLEFVEHFRTQYVQLFPARAPLMLSPENECGVKKFICTFVRPHELPYGELYDVDSCAKYIANYVTYQPLEDPEKLPSRVVAPTTTLAWQAGDCFDMTLLLLSLLLGNGYDAYGVIGYATHDVVEDDQSHLPCPATLPDDSADDDRGKAKAKAADTRDYTIRKRPDLESKFQRAQEEKRRKEAEERARPADDGAAEGSQAHEHDELAGRRVHSWVLVQLGRRDVQKSVFVEPSTGEILPLGTLNYTGIESVFNNHNYWVNMQEGKAVGDLSFNLRDISKWEYIFLTDNEVDEEDTETQERKRVEDLTSDIGESGDQILDLPASWVVGPSLSRQQYENRYPGLQKAIQYRNARLEYFAAYSEPDLKVRRLTYVDEFGLPYEVHTFFAHRTDKLRRRSEFNATETHRAITHEWFDEGRKREQTVRDQTVVEALREHVVEEGTRREMRFYWKARLDGLAKRVELSFPAGNAPTPQKVMEYYEGREDRLLYRSATYSAPAPIPGLLLSDPSSPTGAYHGMEEAKPNPRKMTEKFDRNPTVAADADVAKRTFYNPNTPEGRIRVIYHYAEGKITCPSRHYSKQDPVTVLKADPFAPTPKPSTLQEEMRVLFIKEKECLQLIRESEKEMKEIIAQRLKEENLVEPVTSVYDTLRNKPKEDEEAKRRKEEEARQKAHKKSDLLAPYIEQVVAKTRQRTPFSKQSPLDDVVLTKEEAQKVKELCLKELRDRLVQRAHIMQSRLDDEKEKLARRQSNFQKNQEQIDNAKEHEEYITFCEEAMWRIHILEKRLQRHQNKSLEKYAEMDQQLRRDQRLSVLAY